MDKMVPGLYLFLARSVCHTNKHLPYPDLSAKIQEYGACSVTSIIDLVPRPRKHKKTAQGHNNLQDNIRIP